MTKRSAVDERWPVCTAGSIEGRVGLRPRMQMRMMPRQREPVLRALEIDRVRLRSGD